MHFEKYRWIIRLINVFLTFFFFFCIQILALCIINGLCITRGLTMFYLWIARAVQVVQDDGGDVSSAANDISPFRICPGRRHIRDDDAHAARTDHNVWQTNWAARTMRAVIRRVAPADNGDGDRSRAIWTVGGVIDDRTSAWMPRRDLSCTIIANMHCRHQ